MLTKRPRASSRNVECSRLRSDTNDDLEAEAGCQCQSDCLTSALKVSKLP